MSSFSYTPTELIKEPRSNRRWLWIGLILTMSLAGLIYWGMQKEGKPSSIPADWHQIEANEATLWVPAAYRLQSSEEIEQSLQAAANLNSNLTAHVQQYQHDVASDPSASLVVLRDATHTKDTSVVIIRIALSSFGVTLTAEDLRDIQIGMCACVVHAQIILRDTVFINQQPMARGVTKMRVDQSSFMQALYVAHNATDAWLVQFTTPASEYTQRSSSFHQMMRTLQLPSSGTVDQTSSANDTVQTMLLRGWLMQQRGQWHQAQEMFDHAVELDPHSVDAYKYRAYNAHQLQDWDSAITDLTTALTLDAHNAEVVYSRGAAYYAQGDVEAAFSDFNTALEYDPDMAFAYQGRAVVYTDQGELDAALRDYARAIELQPQDASPYYYRSHVHQLFDPPHVAAAIADLKTAFELEPDSAIQATIERELAQLGATP